MNLPFCDIPEGGVRIVVRGEDDPWEGLRDFCLEASPSGHLFVQKRGRDVFIEGDIRATFWFECSRCLERFQYPVEASLQQMLRPRGNERVESREIELSAEDLEYGDYDEDLIPLARVIEDHLLLSLPMQPLCRGDCKGLCPRCGANRNQEDCTCLENRSESPFDSLKEFVVQKG